MPGSRPGAQLRQVDRPAVLVREHRAERRTTRQPRDQVVRRATQTDHPTLPEAMMEAAEAVHGMAVHIYQKR